MKTEILRSGLQAMDPAERMALVRGGQHVVVDDPPRPPRKLAAGEISRAAFDAMTQAERLATVKSGRQIVDAAE